jgi:glycosyltransferase involved in cell wall biosynthesis
MDLPQTRKDGLDVATGEYFIYLDSDDWVEPNYAELLYNKAQETGAEVVTCDFYNYYSEKEWELVSIVPQGEGENGERLRDDTINRLIPPNLCLHLVRKSIVDENDIAWPVCGMAEDVVLITQISYYAKRLSHVYVPLHHYRFNPNSYVNTKDEKAFAKRAYGYMANLRVVEDFMKKKGINKKYEQGLFMSKVWALAELNPLLDKPKYWWKYVSTYPSVNWALIFGNKYIHLKPIKRLRMLAIMLGIYPVGKRLKKMVCK